MNQGRKIVSATMLLTFSNLSVRLLSLFTLPILTRLLPPEAFGSASIAMSMMALLSVFALAGMDMSYARSHFATQGPSGPAAERFAWRHAIATSVLMGGLGGLGWLVASHWLDLSPGLGVLVGIGVVVSVLNIMALVRARLGGHYRRMAASIFASGVLTAGATITMAMFWRQDGSVIMFGILAGQLLVMIVVGIPAPKMLWHPSGLAPQERRAVLAIGLAGVITAPLYWVLTSLDRWFLGAIDGAATVGIYSVAYNVGALGVMVNTAVAAVWLPEAVKLFEADRQAAPARLGVLAEGLTIGLAVVWLAVTAAGGDTLRLLTPPEYHAGAIAIPFIAGAVFFNGVLLMVNAGALLTHKLYKTAILMLVGGAVCVALNLVLIPVLGLLGAAIAQAASFSMIAVGVWYNNRRVFPLPNGFGKVGACGAAMILAAVGMFPAWSAAPLISLLFKAPVGLAIAATVAYFGAPKIVLPWLRRGRSIFSSRK